MSFFENIHELKCTGIGLIYERFIKFFPILELSEKLMSVLGEVLLTFYQCSLCDNYANGAYL